MAKAVVFDMSVLCEKFPSLVRTRQAVAAFFARNAAEVTRKINYFSGFSPGAAKVFFLKKD